MFTIDNTEVTAVSADHFTQRPAGEATQIVTQGVMLHAGLATLILQETNLMHLTSVGDRHVYSLSVRGYTVAQFIAIATAYANENFDEAARLVNELRLRYDYE